MTLNELIVSLCGLPTVSGSRISPSGFVSDVRGCRAKVWNHRWVARVEALSSSLCPAANWVSRSAAST